MTILLSDISTRSPRSPRPLPFFRARPERHAPCASLSKESALETIRFLPTVQRVVESPERTRAGPCLKHDSPQKYRRPREYCPLPPPGHVHPRFAPLTRQPSWSRDT